jgi:mono/diheme cytochrome c family protein
MKRGQKLYTTECADCHGDAGEGKPGFYPPLSGNRAVALESPVNTIRLVTAGGFSPATAANPRPYGMPPFAQSLSNEQMVDVINYVRNSWGNHADPVHVQDIDRLRNLPLQ